MMDEASNDFPTPAFPMIPMSIYLRGNFHFQPSSRCARHREKCSFITGHPMRRGVRCEGNNHSTCRGEVSKEMTIPCVGEKSPMRRGVRCEGASDAKGITIPRVE